jgi:bifunctional non-homologous end joining protein LigD
MALQEYRKKRRFPKTPEPAGKQRANRKAGALQFVVQKHAARRLHYDLRLECEGVLKSWAVPKGPSLDPKEKRLAVEVEDHPLEYATFEGTIPAGEYGAGEVIVWDRGTWTPSGDAAQGLRKGKLEFTLDGEKLAGRWVLVRTRGGRASDKPNWLLIKRSDEAAQSLADFDLTAQRRESVKSGRVLAVDRPAADTLPQPARNRGKRTATSASERKPASPPGGKRAAMPESIAVQLATLAPQAPSGNAWVHEVKFDGYRMICRIETGKVRLITRNQQDWTHRYRPIVEAVRDLPVKSAILDGEVVALLSSGVTSFQALQNAGKPRNSTRLAYYVFDLLYLDGIDLRGVPLAERKEMLAELVASEPDPHLLLSEHFQTSGPEFFRQCCQLGLEGVVSKRRDRPYFAGRTDDWIKTKCLGREELVIGGFTISTAVKRGLGALLVGYFDEGRLVYAGRVGTGFSERTLLDLRLRLEERKQAASPFEVVPARERGREVRWVRPELVADVEFTAWTDEGILRHPSFQGLREDKSPRDVTRPASLPREEATSMNGKAKTTSVRRGRSQRGKLAAEDGARELLLPQVHVRLTSPDRVLYADIGLTKLGLASYYAQIADWILPHLVDRPLSLVRCPEGQKAGKCFYQKHVRPGTPEALGRVKIVQSDGPAEYVYVKDLDGLLSLAQMNVLEIHPWGARRDNVDRPDRLIFDLDPDEAVPWPRVIEAARAVRQRLEELDLQSFLKTTGGKGLHVTVPIAPRRHTWQQAKAFCKRLAEEFVRGQPDRYVANMAKAARRGKIFIDYLRNDHGATAIAPYSTRARAGAPVATPLDWDELSPSIRSDHFRVANLPSRVASLRRNPWREIGQFKQTLPRLS